MIYLCHGVLFGNKKKWNNDTYYNIDDPWKYSVQSFSRVRFLVTPWTATRQASLSIPNSRSLLKFMSIVNDAIQPSHPLSSPSPPTLNLSQHQGLFKWVSSSHKVAKILGVSASASLLPMSIQDWFPLRWMVGYPCCPRDSQESSPTHYSKATILWYSAFFIIQLSHHTWLLEKP